VPVFHGLTHQNWCLIYKYSLSKKNWLATEILSIADVALYIVLVYETTVDISSYPFVLD